MENNYSPDKPPLSAKERAEAVLNTLKTNKNVVIDAGLAAFATVVPSVLGHPELALIFAPLSQVVRPTIAQRINEDTREKAIAGDWGKYPTVSQEFSVTTLRNAWRTGEVQTSDSPSGEVDDKNRYDKYHPK